MDIIIYSPLISPRLSYVCDFIFKDILNISHILTNNIQFYQESNSVKINYSKNSISKKEIKIEPIDLLFEVEINKNAAHKLHYFDYTLNNFFLQKPHYIEIRFDIFAHIFFLITRYEEYENPNCDTLNRFDYRDSILHRNNIVQIPIIDFWCKYMSQILEMSVESKPTHITEKKFCWLPTFDIDVAFAYRHKPIFLLILRSMYELFQFQFKSLLERFKTLFLNQKDPYDTYGFIHSIHKNGIKPIFFWLVAPSRNKYDTNISPFNPEIKSLINKWSEIYDIGIHPSYTSNFNPENINTEKNILQNIITKPVTKSRQHYLMLKLPATYRRLIDNSITDDYTMGYHNTVGFRAGTSFPFLWYDLENEQTTTLRVHPFCIMDVALKNHMELSSNEAWLITKKIIDTLKKADGIFMSIWHNSSFSEIHGWSGWKEFYQEIDDYCHAINEM